MIFFYFYYIFAALDLARLGDGRIEQTTCMSQKDWYNYIETLDIVYVTLIRYPQTWKFLLISGRSKRIFPFNNSI